MRDEIAAAVVFISRLLKRNKNLSTDQLENFSDQLSSILLERFKNHWHTDHPVKGQGYRCIRVNDCERVDPVLLRAAEKSGIEAHALDLSAEITLWVDPSEVSCRFGETKSAYCMVATVKDGKLDNRACSLDLDDLIREHNRKKEDDLNKLKEFTERRSPTLYPGDPVDMTLHYQPSGEVHMPLEGVTNGHHHHVNGGGYHHHGDGRWGARSQIYSHHHHNHHHNHAPPQHPMRRSSPPFSSSPPVTVSTPTRKRSPIPITSAPSNTTAGNNSSSNNVLGSMKTGHRTGSPYQWSNGNKSASPAKA